MYPAQEYLTVPNYVVKPGSHSRGPIVKLPTSTAVAWYKLECYLSQPRTRFSCRQALSVFFDWRLWAVHSSIHKLIFFLLHSRTLIANVLTKQPKIGWQALRSPGCHKKFHARWELEAMFPSNRPWHVNYLKTLAEQTDDRYEYRAHCEGETVVRVERRRHFFSWLQSRPNSGRLTRSSPVA